MHDYSSEEIHEWLDFARQIKQSPEDFKSSLEGKTLGMIFNKKSTRTRISFEVGITQLGGSGIFLGPDDLQLSRGETIADTAKVLSRYLDGIVIRTYSYQDVLQLAQHASIPVINGLTDFNHPCQALADMLTLQERFGDLAGRKLAYLGDGNNVAVSLLFACVKVGMNIALISPPGYTIDEKTKAMIQNEAQAKQLDITITSNIPEGVADADAVYTDVWTSMGQEEENAPRQRVFKDYAVTDQVMAGAKPDAVFMHCLPAHRGEEVSASVIDGAASIVFDQAENRLHLQKAVMLKLMK